MKIISNKNHANQFKKRPPRKKQNYLDEIQREIETIFQALTSKH